MNNPYRVLTVTLNSVLIVLGGLLFLTNAASGTTPLTLDSGTASCTTDSLGYCGGPTLPFRPNAVAITAQAPVTGPTIPAQVVAQLTPNSFRMRFINQFGSALAARVVTYSYIATRGVTSTPTTTAPTPTTTGSTGTVIVKAYVTAYGWPDNTPAGCAVSNTVIHNCAGGIGTFADPITIAVGHSLASGKDVLDYAAGTKFYIPNVRRYFIVEDTCGDGSAPQNGPCHNLSQAPAGTSVWVDMWAGGNGNNSPGVLACEGALTENHTIVLNPDANRTVVQGALFNSTTGTCTAQFGD